MRWISSQWTALTRPERWLFFVCWPLGAALLVAGLWADASGWWGQHAFLVEAAGSLTAFLIGIPLVVAVIGRLQSDAAERAVFHSQARRAHSAAQLLAASLLDSYVATTWDRIDHQDVDGRKLLLQPLDQDTIAALRMAEPGVSAFIIRTRDACTPYADAHDEMSELAKVLGNDIHRHDPDMMGRGEVLWKQHVPELLGMGALSLAAEEKAKHDAWQRLARHADLPMKLENWSWESPSEAVEYLDQLRDFYADVGSMLKFLMMMLKFTEEHLPSSTRRRA